MTGGIYPDSWQGLIGPEMTRKCPLNFLGCSTFLKRVRREQIMIAVAKDEKSCSSSTELLNVEQ